MKYATQIMILVLLNSWNFVSSFTDFNTKYTDDNNVLDGEPKYTITIETSKNKYKMYEPIHLLYKIINTSNEIDTFSQEFYNYQEFVDYKVSSINTGKNYNERNYYISGLIVPRPILFLMPGDTMIIGMILNSYYGEKFPPGKVMFGLFYGYFLPGEYKASAKIRFYNGRNYTTNEVSFEVEKLTVEDEYLIDMEDTKNYNDSAINISGSYFTELLIIQQLNDYYPHYEKNYKPTKEDILEKYESFLKRFPDSYFCYGLGFVGSLLFKLAYTNSDIIYDIEYFIEKHSKSTISKFLEQPAIKNLFIMVITELRNALHNQR